MLSRSHIGKVDTDEYFDCCETVMCRRALLTLEPVPQAASEARRFVAATCKRWGVEEVADIVSLAVSELVTNALLHAHTEIEIELCVANRALEACVADHDPRPPVMRPGRSDLLADLDLLAGVNPELDERQSLHVGASGSVTAGRGLLIVNALADEWGVSERSDGKEVWFTLAVPWAHSEPCECSNGRGSARLASSCRHISGEWDGGT
jgi:anti-sigma regulatory factor (Ser/Thr protein kinase)